MPPHRSDDETRELKMARLRWERELADRDLERQAVIGRHRDRVGIMSDRDLDLVVTTAYWCEGTARLWQGIVLAAVATRADAAD